MTEKDASKCKDFDNNKIWYLKIDADVNNKFIDNLDKKLKSISNNMIKNTYILIPSRIGSTRLKNKPLIDLDGKSIIQRAISNALSITENAYVATDSDLIKSNVEKLLIM